MEVWNLKPYQWTFILYFIKNPLAYLVLCVGCLSMCDFVTMRWPFRKYWFTELCTFFLNIDTFHYITSNKSILLISPLISLETTLNVEKPWSSQSQTQIFQILIYVWNFPNSDLCLKAWILSLATNFASCFP